MKNLANILIFCLLFVWQLPQNLVALCWLPFAGRVRKIAYRNYCIALSGRLPKEASPSSPLIVPTTNAPSGTRWTATRWIPKSSARSTCWSLVCHRCCTCCTEAVLPRKNPTTISTRNAGPTATRDCDFLQLRGGAGFADLIDKSSW